MPEISSELPKRLRLPPSFGGVNVNFCKNPLCLNFGVPAEIEYQGGRRRSSNQASLYVVTGSGTDTSIKCTCCGVHSVIKSNKAVWEEYGRRLQFLALPRGHHCPNANCLNFHRSADSHPESYYRHGTSASGEPRFRCRECRSTFSMKPAHKRQITSHENKTVFQLLVSKVCLTKIGQVSDLAPKTVYDKIDFIYRQCLKFVAERERRLTSIPFSHLRISTDMQDYMVNWPTRSMRKTIQFRAIASSCLDSGYVLACHPQIDMRYDIQELQDAVEACGDLQKKPAFREFARLWNAEDYASALKLPPNQFAPVREDQELPEHMTVDRQLPEQGALVHIDYLALGHFMYLHHLVGHSDYVHFSLDADPGLPTAVLATWKDKAKAKALDVAVMSFDKSATIDQKNLLIAQANKLKDEAETMYPDLHPFKAWMKYFIDNSPLRDLYGAPRGHFLRSDGVEYPFVKKSEPGKFVRLYTDDGARGSLEIAELLHDTSLHQVDRFFMQIRRGISGLERAPSYPRRAARKWYLYGFYSPEMVEKCLTIYRTYFNFIAKGKDGKTPAMRIGLAKGVIRFEDIIYFE